jgi:hypothetical protein
MMLSQPFLPRCKSTPKYPLGIAELTKRAQYHYHTVQNYLSALKFGVKYIYRTMPRLLTIWLDLGENFSLHTSYVPIYNNQGQDADG